MRAPYPSNPAVAELDAQLLQGGAQSGEVAGSCPNLSGLNGNKRTPTQASQLGELALLEPK